MKHLYSYIVCLFLVFNNSVHAAEKIAVPEDFGGEATIQQIELFNKGENKPLTTEQVFQILYEVGHYFYDKYTVDDIFRKDFIDEIRPFFPNDSDEQLEHKLSTLRFGVSLYGKVKDVYKEYVTDKLVPHVYKKVKNSQEYDHPDEIKYIEAEPGYFVKVNNFKKFLTYSANEDERQAIVDFENAKENENSIRNKIIKIIENSDWKKMLLYGSVYDNPLASKQGISEEQTSLDVRARLLSKNSYISGNKSLDFGILFNCSPYTFIVANDVSPEITKPQISLENSENIEKSEIFYPVPFNADNYPFVHKYFGEFLLPIRITVQDVNKPIVVRADVKVFSCDNDLICSAEKFNFELTLLPDGPEVLSNGYENYFNINFARIPVGDNKHLTLKKFVVDKDKDNNQVLRLEFISDKKIKNFKIFAESENDIILFEAPYINLQENKVYVRLIPREDANTIDMADMPFTISAVLNNRYYYRAEKTAGIASDFDVNSIQLNLGLFIMALLGGFILNFMPCVFPVISLKMMAFARIEKKYRQQLKNDIRQTVIGIFCGFTLLILMLWVAKYWGYSLGWGMQFQNMGFLVAMVFIITSIIIALPVLNFDSMLLPSLGKYSGFLVGNLIVLLATPCTGPYLASAIGFALSGGYRDILIMLYGVALGLSAPYLMILMFKKPETLFPKPGKWMHKLEIFMRIMLYLTIAWFLLLIFEQTDIIFLLKFSGIIVFFALIINLCKKFLDYLDSVPDKKFPQEALVKIRRGCYVFMLIIFVLCSFICTRMAQTSFSKNYEKNMQDRLTFIDKNLINNYLNEGHPVLVEISADWCLTCQTNKIFVFNKANMENWKTSYNLEFLRVDWTNYNKDILEYMGRYGRKGLPFYILYTPFIREGMVLPEIFDEADLSQILQVSRLR